MRPIIMISMIMIAKHNANVLVKAAFRNDDVEFIVYLFSPALNRFFLILLLGDLNLALCCLV